MANQDFDPLFGEPVDEVPLPRSPLTTVVAQVQFTPIMRLRSEDYVAVIQDKLRGDYPKLEAESILCATIMGGETEARRENVWRFVCGKNQWRVTLTPTFVALETRAYTSRTDFTERFKRVVVALKDSVGSARVTRVGVRYVDHIKPPEVEHMSGMLRSDMLGVANTALRPRMHHAVSEMFCDVAEGNLLARWGFLPPHGTHDPNVMMPIPDKSWFIDIDVSKQYNEPFEEMDADSVHQIAYALATRSYSFFRWVSTPSFLQAYGGNK